MNEVPSLPCACPFHIHQPSSFPSSPYSLELCRALGDMSIYRKKEELYYEK